MKNKYTYIGLLWLLSPVLKAQTYDFTAITKLMNDSLTEISTLAPQSRGAVVMVYHKSKLVYNQAFNRTGGSFSYNFQVPIASATKWLSAATIATLIDEGLIKLDDSVGKYLPIFTQYGKGKATIRQCFAHTAGFSQSDYHTNTALTLKNATDSIAVKTALLFPANTGFSYGGTSMHIVGRIAEIVTNQSWDTLFKRRIATPLGLTKTDYEGLGETDNPQIAGGARSNARDYSLFLQMLLNDGKHNGQQIISKKMCDEILKDQTNNLTIFYSPYLGTGALDPNLPNNRYGFGCWLEKKDMQGRNVEFGSQGAFGWSPWIDTTRQLTGVMGAYYTYQQVLPTYLQLKKLVAQAVDKVTPTIEIDNTHIKFYPNIAQNYVTIEADKLLKDVHFIDITGRIESFRLETDTKMLDISQLNKGFYKVIFYDARMRLHPTFSFVKY